MQDMQKQMVQYWKNSVEKEVELEYYPVPAFFSGKGSQFDTIHQTIENWEESPERSILIDLFRFLHGANFAQKATKEFPPCGYEFQGKLKEAQDDMTGKGVYVSGSTNTLGATLDLIFRYKDKGSLGEEDLKIFCGIFISMQRHPCFGGFVRIQTKS